MRNSLGESLAQWLRDTSLYEWHQRANGRRSGPKFTAAVGRLDLLRANATFVVICGANFNQGIPNASTTMRMGWCRGFEELGIPYILLSAYMLKEVLPSVKNPICWISGSDYAYLNDRDLTLLRGYKHAVLVSTAFNGDDDYFRKRGFPRLSWSKRLCRKILSSEPSFLFTISPESRFEYYAKWVDSGAKLVSLPLACDVSLYCKASSSADVPAAEVAFVGGYWPYKARQFDSYLRPLKSVLTVFGYSPWPYGRYGGVLPDHLEAALYSSANISPVINEPHVSEMGIDINERVFKVLGAGGLAVTDVTPGYREWFSIDELMVPGTLTEFMDFVWSAIKNPDEYLAFRSRGRDAVLNRHTYRHRALKFAQLMGIDLPVQ